MEARAKLLADNLRRRWQREGADNHLALDQTAHTAYWRARRLKLTEAEWKVLAVMYERRGRATSYCALYGAVHGVGFHVGQPLPGCTSGPHTNAREIVKRLRRKFKAIDPGFARIVTHFGFGYRWRI